MKTLDYSFRHAWDNRLGLSHNTVERIVHSSESWRLAQLGKISLDAYWQDIAAQLKLSPEDLHQLQKDFFKGDYLDADIVDYIHRLRANQHPVGLLSNDSPALLPKLKQLCIAHLFDPLIISAHIGYMKPAPEAYQAVLDALQLPADEIVFIDDMPANTAGAQAVGMKAIHYTPTLNLPDALESWLQSG